MSQELAWGSLGILMIFATIFATLPIAGAFFFRPRKAHDGKESTYECGLHPKKDTWNQINIQYYLFALAFLIFSIEILYVYPWAINFQKLGPAALLEMFLFLGVLIVGLAYAWRKGGLEWK